MQAAGLEAIEHAKKNGRWDAAYDSLNGATVPADFQAALDANPQAAAFFKTLTGANRYAVLFRIQTVKRAETRARKIDGSLPCWRGKRGFIPNRTSAFPHYLHDGMGSGAAGTAPKFCFASSPFRLARSVFINSFQFCATVTRSRQYASYAVCITGVGAASWPSTTEASEPMERLSAANFGA